MSQSFNDLIETVQFIENISAKIHGLLDEAEIYGIVKEEFAKSKKYDAAIFSLTEDRSKVRIAETSILSDKVGIVEKLTGLGRMKDYMMDLDKLSALSEVVREGKTVQANVNDMLSELFSQTLAHAIAKTIGYENKLIIVTPLERHEEITGILAVSSPELAEYFIPSVKNLAQHVSNALELADQYAERKRMENELRSSEERFRQITENAGEWIWEIDADGLYTYSSPTVEKILGYKPEEIVGKKYFYELYPPSIEEKLSKSVTEIFAKKKTYKNLVISKVHKSGNVVTLEGSGIPILDEKGELIGYRCAETDITERKKMEEKLRLYSEHLEKLVEERIAEIEERLVKAERIVTIGETAAMIGHDLRNPLQGISNNVFLAKERLNALRPVEAKKQVLKNLEKIVKQVKYMDKIVSDLQDYARTLKPKLVPTDIRQLIDETLSTINIPENIEFSTAIPANFPDLMIDTTLMRRALTNLVINAVQAMSEGGKLRIRAEMTDKDALVSVEDTGIGISEENMNKLFQPLFTTKPRGQGLGLPVCKRIVEAHGGDILVENQVGRGTTFTIRIPLGGR